MGRRPGYSALRSLRLALVFALCGAGTTSGQQRADTAFLGRVGRSAFLPGIGPAVLIDEAHHNFHTADGRYRPFADLLRRDGFVVRSSRNPLDSTVLRQARILVIANALADTGEWVLPAHSAFTRAEIVAVEHWVRNGGSLLLMADHMPFPGAAEALAGAFGIVFQNGFALHPGDYDGRLVFRRLDGTLAAEAITGGRDRAEQIDSVVGFTGQAFRARRPVRALLTIDSTVTVYFPVRAWEFTPQTPQVSGAGLLQGAVFRHGSGRVAVFGEAAMFSAQLSGPRGRPMGMNDPAAPQNAQFALNVIHWLAGILEPGSANRKP